ncbi:protein muscleblind [Eurytemora carolleeae]|uniref:protein muscleblind n=1 Tax=Eurytemora carolleeae TaxID=1294199 RepID=UPI000C75CB56|nr:protein muscleblind [Eurytemora carolleeae]|eukprot:XP_023339459.1 protein muscleblind-like [Eurytemora affinis]
MLNNDLNQSVELIEKVKLTVDRRDNGWLQLHVCPEFRKTGVCGADARAELCIYAHPPPENRNLLILNSGLNNEIVVCCFEDVFRTCAWTNCKFYHPPDHLKNLVKTNGKNNLRLRNELKQSLGIQSRPQNTLITPVGVQPSPQLPYYFLPHYPTQYYKQGVGPSVYTEQAPVLYKDDEVERDVIPPGESISKKRSRTPEPVQAGSIKRAPSLPQPFYDPFRRYVVQDVGNVGGSMVYPPPMDIYGLSMFYQNPGTVLPSYPYLLNYSSGGFGGMPPPIDSGINFGLEQFQIPTLTSSRNVI